MIFTFIPTSLSLTVLIYLVKAQTQSQQKTTIWTDNFTTGVYPTACQCQNWVDFWQFWIGDPSQVVSITLSGSLTSTTHKCSGSAAQFVAFALAIPPFETTQVTCESGIWFTGKGYYQTLAGNAVSVNDGTTVCSNCTAIRPCWPNVDWGGIGSSNCGAPTQTFKVTVVSNIPAVTLPPASVTWTDSFAYRVPATYAQCDNWKQFWQNAVPKTNTLSVTLKSTISWFWSVSATCSGPGVNLLATALFTPSSNGQIHCNEGSVWYFNGIYLGNSLYPAFPNTSGISINDGSFACPRSLILRPCWDQPLTANWGGFGGVTCGAPGQKFTATVTIGAKAISNTCWQQLSIDISTGIFAISCNSITLQCNTNYSATGYGPNPSGFYTCANATWSPAVPTCVVQNTTTASTSTVNITTSSTTNVFLTQSSSSTASTLANLISTTNTFSVPAYLTANTTSDSNTPTDLIRPSTTTVSTSSTTSTPTATQAYNNNIPTFLNTPTTTTTATRTSTIALPTTLTSKITTTSTPTATTNLLTTLTSPISSETLTSTTTGTRPTSLTTTTLATWIYPTAASLTVASLTTPPLEVNSTTVTETSATINAPSLAVSSTALPSTIMTLAPTTTTLPLSSITAATSPITTYPTTSITSATTLATTTTMFPTTALSTKTTSTKTTTSTTPLTTSYSFIDSASTPTTTTTIVPSTTQNSSTKSTTNSNTPDTPPTIPSPSPRLAYSPSPTYTTTPTTLYTASPTTITAQYTTTADTLLTPTTTTTAVSNTMSATSILHPLPTITLTTTSATEDSTISPSLTNTEYTSTTSKSTAATTISYQSTSPTDMFISTSNHGTSATPTTTSTSNYATSTNTKISTSLASVSRLPAPTRTTPLRMDTTTIVSASATLKPTAGVTKSVILNNFPRMHNLPMIATTTKIWWWPFIFGSVLFTAFVVLIFASLQCATLNMK